MNPSTIVKPCQEKILQQSNLYCGFDQTLVDDFQPDMLNAGYWQAKNAVLTTAQGRGITYFVQHQNKQWVLRHYYRGGLVGKLIHDSYWFTGWQQTRAAQEYQLLKQLENLNLPAPKAVAYRVKKSGFVYQADILTQRIEHAQDLVALLSNAALAPSVWLEIGKTIKQFHHHGIYHHDLNAHNILLDDNDKVWIIDFDRGEQRAPAKSWQQANLDRLLRSFNKENNKLANFHWQTENWQLLLEGYLS